MLPRSFCRKVNMIVFTWLIIFSRAAANQMFRIPEYQIKSMISIYRNESLPIFLNASLEIKPLTSLQSSRSAGAGLRPNEITLL